MLMTGYKMYIVLVIYYVKFQETDVDDCQTEFTHDCDDDVGRPAKILSTDAKPYHFFDALRTDNLQNREFNRAVTAEMSSAEHWKKYKANMNGSTAALKFIESTRGMAVEKRYNVGLLRTTGFTSKALEAFIMLHLDIHATKQVS